MSTFTGENHDADATPRRDAATDVELMRRVIERDETALETLFNRYRDAVYAVCLQVLKNQSDAEETLVDIFMEVWRRPERFNIDRGNVSTYLMVLARSRAIDHLRSRASRTRAMAPAASEYLEQYRDTGQGPLEACSLAERRKLALKALATLMPAQREAVHYSFFEGLSHREIAERLNLPLGTVKTRIRLGLLRFRDAFRNLDTHTTKQDEVGRPSPTREVATAKSATPQPEASPAPAKQPAEPELPVAKSISGREMIRVLLADDHDIFREGLASLLQEEPDIQIVGEARDGHDAVRLAQESQPDVVLMDVTMPGLDGIEATRKIAGEWPSMRIIGLSMHERRDMTTAMCTAGAEAYLNKNEPSEELIATIHGNRNVASA